MVAAIVVIVLLITGSGVQAVSTPTPVPASVLAAVTNPGLKILTDVGHGGQPGQLSRLSGSTVLKDSSGKPEVIFVGADYPEYDQHRQIIDRLSLAGNQEDIVLRGHLYVEYWLNEMILKEWKKGDIIVGNFTFSQKVSIAESTGLVSDGDIEVIACLREINAIRNRLLTICTRMKSKANSTSSQFHSIQIQKALSI